MSLGKSCSGLRDFNKKTFVMKFIVGKIMRKSDLTILITRSKSDFLGFLVSAS